MAVQISIGKRFMASLIAIFLVSGLVMAYHKSQSDLWMSISPYNITGDHVLQGDRIEMPVKAGDVIIYHWIHSFEHIPWKEYFRVEKDGSLALYRIEVAGFGAGIPENKGEVTIEDGMVVMQNFEERFESIHWIHSQTALSFISVNDEVIINGFDLPHHQPLHLEVKARVFK
jgi:hypothetical protein